MPSTGFPIVRVNRVAACTAASVALLALALPAAPGHAAVVSLACEANPALDLPEMSITYDGESDGTLTIVAPFGEMMLPATKETREGTDDAGQPVSATGIRAAGPATVLMPDKAAIEACVADKLSADQLADSDIVFMAVMGCASAVPLADEPVAVNAAAEIALEPLVYVGVARTYVEPTDLAVGTIALEAYPNCVIK